METEKVVKWTTYLGAQSIFQYLFSFAFFVIISRLLVEAEVGEISLLLLARSLFITFTALAIPTAAQRFIAERLGQGKLEEASAVYKTTLLLTLALSAPALTVAVLISPQLSLFLLGTSADSTLLILIFATAFTLNLTGLLGAYMLGLGLFAEVMLQNIIYIVLWSMGAVVLVFLGYDVLGVALSWLLATLVTLIFSPIFLKVRLSFRVKGFLVRPLSSTVIPSH